MKWWIGFLAAGLSLGESGGYGATADAVLSPVDVKLSRLLGDDRVQLVIDGKKITVERGERAGSWTLVEIVPASAQDMYRGNPGYAVLEDYSELNGHLIFVDTRGVQIDLPKSSESTASDPPKLHLELRMAG